MSLIHRKVALMDRRWAFFSFLTSALALMFLLLQEPAQASSGRDGTVFPENVWNTATAHTPFGQGVAPSKPSSDQKLTSPSTTSVFPGNKIDTWLAVLTAILTVLIAIGTVRGVSIARQHHKVALEHRRLLLKQCALMAGIFSAAATPSSNPALPTNHASESPPKASEPP